MSATPKVLVCVVDWGLGHATRSLALIRALQEHRMRFVIASSGKALALLRLELPEETFYELPSYGISYGNSGFVSGMVGQIPKIFRTVKLERIAVQQIVSKEQPDVIVSDSCYGCYHAGVRSIFLSHQLQIQLHGGWRLLKGIVNFFHGWMISRFDERWIPDYPDRSMSGTLSRASARTTFIGPLSTMRRYEKKIEKKYDVLAVLSGPEPQRTIFADILSAQLKDFSGQWLMVHGLPGEAYPADEHNVPFMTREKLNEAMEAADIVIARSGYSTVMDIAALNKIAILVPTPGQTEQIYLANKLMENRIAFTERQDSISLKKALDAVKQYSGFPGRNGQRSSLLNEAVKSLQTAGG